MFGIDTIPNAAVAILWWLWIQIIQVTNKRTFTADVCNSYIQGDDFTQRERITMIPFPMPQDVILLTLNFDDKKSNKRNIYRRRLQQLRLARDDFHSKSGILRHPFPKMLPQSCDSSMIKFDDKKSNKLTRTFTTATTRDFTQSGNVLRHHSECGRLWFFDDFEFD